jgi:hypothetical protein
MVKYLSISSLKKHQAFSQKRALFSLSTPAKLPAAGSVKNKVTEVYDQGDEGSCTANAFCGAYRILESDKTFNPSRQYVYWKERLVENGGNAAAITDSGADVEDAVRYVAQYGVCSEASWPYNTATVDTPPPASCDVEAAKHTLGALSTIQVGDLTSIKTAICAGQPVMIAIGVYQSFESAATARTGVVKIPHPQQFEDPNDPVDPFLGGHEILIVGYTDSSKLFTVLNSWGTSWGHGGFCYLPYAYVSNPQLTYELCCLAPKPKLDEPAAVADKQEPAAAAAAVTAAEPVATKAPHGKKHKHHHKKSKTVKQEAIAPAAAAADPVTSAAAADPVTPAAAAAEPTPAVDEIIAPTTTTTTTTPTPMTQIVPNLKASRRGCCCLPFRKC